jgi:hypothetical protein
MVKRGTFVNLANEDDIERENNKRRKRGRGEMAEVFGVAHKALQQMKYKNYRKL